MSFFSFFAPPSTESDEDLVNRRIRDLTSNTDVENAIRDIEPLARQFSSLIGINASTPLIHALTTFKNDDDMIMSILKIMNELVRDDSLESNSNAGFIINEGESLLNIFECLSNQKPSIRGLALTLVKNLVRLQLPKIQTTILEDPRAQELILQLADDANEMIRSHFLYLVPQIVQGNPEIQKCFAFRLLDWLADRIAEGGSGDLFDVLQALLDGNLQTQKLFVETGHLSKLVPALKRGDEKGAEFLVMLFSSSDAAPFQKFVAESGLMPPVMEHALDTGKGRGLFWRLLAAMIKGNTDLCGAVSPILEKLVLAIVQERNERSDGLYFAECYALKGAQTLADVLCEKLGSVTVSILSSFGEKRVEAANVIVCARCCLIANHDTLSTFLGFAISPDTYFFNCVTAMIGQVNGDNVLILPIMQFIAAGVWESGIAAEKFVQSATNVIVQLCMRATDEPLRSIACLAVLEALLFKTKSPVFSQLVAAVKTHIGVSEMVAAVDAYAKSLSDKGDVSLWSEFVQECVRVIKKNSDALLSDNVEVKSESGQLALLQAKLTEAIQEKEVKEKENEELLKQLEENQTALTTLENQLQEFTTAMEAYDRMLKEYQESGATKDAENEQLNNRIQKLEEQIRLGGSSGIQTESNQFDELKAKLEEDLKRLRKENEDLKEAVENLKSDDALDKLTKENRDLKQQLETARQQITELCEMQNDYEKLRAEMAQMLQSGVPTPTGTDNTEEISMLRAQIATLQEQISKQESGNYEHDGGAATDAQIEALEKKYNDLQKEFDVKLALIADLERSNNEVMEELEQALDQKDEISEKLNKKKEKIKNLKMERTTNTSDLQGEKLTLEAQNEELKTEIEQQKKLCGEKDIEIEEYKRAIQEKEDDITAIMESIEQQKGSMEEVLAKKDEEIKTISEHLSEMEQKLFANEDANSQRIKEIKDVLEQKSQDISEKDARIHDLELNLAELQKKYDVETSQEKERHSLEEAKYVAELKNRADEIKSLQEENAKLAEGDANLQEIVIKQQALENEKRELQSRVSDLEAQLELEAKKYQELQLESETQKGSFEHQLNQLKEKIAELKCACDETNEKLQKKSEKVKANRERFQAQIQQLQNEKIELDKQLSEAQANAENSENLQQIQGSEIERLRSEVEEEKKKSENLAAELSNLKEKMTTDSTNEKQQLADLMEEMSKQKTEFEEIIRKQKSEIENLNATMAERDETIESLNQLNSQAETQEYLQTIQEQQSEIERLRSEVEDEKHKSENLKTELSNLREQITTDTTNEKQQLADMVEEMSKQKTEFDETILKQKTEIERLKMTIAERGETIESLNQLNSQAETQEYLQTIQEQQSEIERLRSEVEDEKQKSESLAAELSNLKEQITTDSTNEKQQLADMAEEMSQQKTEFEEIIRKQKSEIENLNATIAKRDEAIANLNQFKSQSEKLEEKQRQLEATVKKLKSECTKAQQVIKKKESEIATLSEQASSKDTEIGKLKAEVSNVKDNLAATSSLQQEKAAAEELVQKQQSQLAEAQAASAQAIENLKEELHQTEMQLQAAKTTAKATQDKLMCEIADLKEELQSQGETIKLQQQEITTLKLASEKKSEQTKNSNSDEDSANDQLIEEQRLEIQELKATSKKQEEKIRELNGTLSKLMKQQKDLEEKDKQNSETESMLRAELTKLNDEIKTKNQELAESSDRIKELGEQLNEGNSCLVDKAQYEELENRHRKLERKLLDMEIQNDSQKKSEADVQQLRMDLKKKKAELDQCKAVIDELNKKLATKAAKSKSRKQELHKLQQPEKGSQSIRSQLYDMKLQVEKFRGEVTDASSDSDIVDVLKHHLASIISEADIQRQRNEIQEMELKQLRVQNSRKSDEVRKCKRAAEKAVKTASKMQKDYESMKATVGRHVDRVAELEEELRILSDEDSKLQKRHQSALRLIGELWTRNQTLSRRSSPMSDRMGRQ